MSVWRGQQLPPPQVDGVHGQGQAGGESIYKIFYTTEFVVKCFTEVKALFIKIPRCYIDPHNTPPQTQLRQHYLFTKSRLIFFSCHKQVENKQKCFFSITVGDDELNNIQNTYLDIDITDAWPPTIWRLIILE